MLKISDIPEMFTPRDCVAPVEIRPSLTSLSEQASAQYLWQPKSLPISSEQTCQTMRQVNVLWHCIHVDEMQLHRPSERGGRKTETMGTRKISKSMREGGGLRCRNTPTYLLEISIKIATHILGHGVTHCRNLLWSDTTLNKASHVMGLWVSLRLCS